MRASIIIAAHQEGDRLWKTVGSCVEAAIGLDHEIVVADDASTDGSVEELERRFPQVRVVRHDQRRGASPTKALGGRNARGDVLVFLDGHTKPEPGALRRLVDDVDAVDGEAVITPSIAPLNCGSWQSDAAQAGHGYTLDLRQFSCGWLGLDKLRAVEMGGRRFYESPALIGCALAVGRELYDKLWGFDSHMRIWGVEDLDFGLKCWLLGYRILHDPEALVGHRFRSSFDNYKIPAEQVLVNQLRMARKHFTPTVWAQWVDHCRELHPGALPDFPEGLWARAWKLFEADRESAEQERVYIMGHRVRDEFWFAERFALPWPHLARAAGFTVIQPALADPSPSPPPCDVTGVTPTPVTICMGQTQTFTAQGTGLDAIVWAAQFGIPDTGHGPAFTTKWDRAGANFKVYARCSGNTQRALVTVVSLAFSTDLVNTGFLKTLDNPCGNPYPQIAVPVQLTVVPAAEAANIGFTITGVNRITMDRIVRNTATGIITFFVTGTSATPASKPGGDTTIQALVGEYVCAEVNVVVRIPKTLQPVSKSGMVAGVNQAADGCSSPAFLAPLAPNTVHLWTYYVQFLTIPVLDQFGASIAALYQGAPVTEQGGLNINQTINAFGSYLDPVGNFVDRQDPNVLKGGTDATNWEDGTDPVLPTFAVDVTPPTIPVQVGGHSVSPGTAGRHVQVVPLTRATAEVDITWQ